MSYFLPFHTVSGVLQARILEWIAISFLSGPCFVRTLHYDPSILGPLHSMAHSFIQLCKSFAVIRLQSMKGIDPLGSVQISIISFWLFELLKTTHFSFINFT